jgi:hypothetical protein
MSASDPRTNVGTVDLQCGHQAQFDPPPNLHDIVYCRKCLKYSPVIGGDQMSIPELYLRRMRCRECIFRPRHKYDLEIMESAARAHAIKYDHAVEIWDGEGRYHVVTKNSERKRANTPGKL